jgi:hypothetical protein
MKEIRLMLKLLLWTIETLWLGLRACVRGVWLTLHLPRAFQKEVRCPRGHRVPTYGTYACGRCGARYEGAAFALCPSCGALARHVTCPTCGLSVKDPLA